jgi:long-chain acyl-CoA synthetase
MQLQSLADALRRAEHLHGHTTAVVCGNVRLDYRAFAARCRRLAGGLAGMGVAPGDRVAVLMQNCHRYLDAYFAVPGMGAVIVPLNNRHAVPEHRYILEDAGVRVLLVDEAHAAVAEQLRSCVDRVVVAPRDYEQLLAESTELPLSGPGDENDVAGLYYTGGTTGRSKGVMLTHRNLVLNAFHITMALGYTDADVYLHAAPMFHLADGASTYAITWVGGRHVFVPGFEPGAVLDAIETEKVSCTIWVPTMINAVVNDARAAVTDFGSMRIIAHGGAPIAEDLLQRAFSTFQCSFAQVYGMTEAAPLLTVLPDEETLVGDPRLRSAGREGVGCEVTVRRPDGSLCEPGEIGEIVARGPNFMLGYWNKPQETAQALRDGWYWSGDGGYMDEEGYVYIVDRLKDMIVSGGENVYSIEVENALCSHPAILEAAVIGVPDEQWGERVHAVVVLRPGQDAPEAELQEHCRALIAGYKIPRSVEFTDALPKSGAGKILKRELRDKHWAGLARQVN